MNVKRNTPEEMLEVIKAYQAGHKIRHISLTCGIIEAIDNPSWNFNGYRYEAFPKIETRYYLVDKNGYRSSAIYDTKEEVERECSEDEFFATLTWEVNPNIACEVC